MSIDTPAFSDYVPPKKIKENAFTIRLDNETHARLLAWISTIASGDLKSRAVASEHMLAAFLDHAGVPRDPKELHRWRMQNTLSTWIDGEFQRESA